MNTVNNICNLGDSSPNGAPCKAMAVVVQLVLVYLSRHLECQYP